VLQCSELIVRQMQENCRVKGKRFYVGVVDLEEVFDRVLRSDKMGVSVEEWLVSAVMSLYAGAKTDVRTVYGNDKCFAVKVGIDLYSALSPLL